jgi:hypothetical protein
MLTNGFWIVQGGLPTPPTYTIDSVACTRDDRVSLKKEGGVLNFHFYQTNSKAASVGKENIALPHHMMPAHSKSLQLSFRPSERVEESPRYSLRTYQGDLSSTANRERPSALATKPIQGTDHFIRETHHI